MTETRAYLAFYGGPDPSPQLSGPRMDHEIALAYVIGVRRLGGFTARGEETFTMTRAERLRSPSLVPIQSLPRERRLAKANPNEIVREVREGWIVIPPISDNTWVGASEDVATAVQNAVAILGHDHAKIDEIVFIDHGSPGSMTFGTDVFDRRSVQSGRVGNTLRRLAPFVDDRSILTLGGCAVGGNQEGRDLARTIAGILGVRVQVFEQIQYINLAPGVEGKAYMCGPSQCTEGKATPFSETLYEGVGTQGGKAFGMRTPGWG